MGEGSMLQKAPGHRVVIVADSSMVAPVWIT